MGEKMTPLNTLSFLATTVGDKRAEKRKPELELTQGQEQKQKLEPVATLSVEEIITDFCSYAKDKQFEPSKKFDAPVHNTLSRPSDITESEKQLKKQSAHQIHLQKQREHHRWQKEQKEKMKLMKQQQKQS